MNRDTRDKFVATTDQSDLAYGESACSETPPDLFAALHAEFHFNVDLTANEHNHLLPVWFGPKGLYESCTRPVWSEHGQSGFSNPPYGHFVEHLLEKAVAQQDFISVFLLPLRASRWYKQFVLPYADEVRHLPRVTFWYQGKPKETYSRTQQKMVITSALFDSMVVVYRTEPRLRHGWCCPHFSVWSWK